MEKALLGKTGFMVSRVTYGGIVSMNETQKDSDKYVSMAVDAGVNYFDVAPSYGDAQERLGPSLEPYRKDVYLACKTQMRDAKGAKAELLKSLEVLRTDYFDVYQLHAMTTSEDLEQVFAPGGAMETLVWAKREGIIRNIGITTHSEDCVLKALDQFPFDTVLFPMNWSLGMNTGWGDRISERIKRDNIGLLAMKTLIHRTWRDGEEHLFPKSWCKPLWDNEDLMVAGMKYGLYKGAATLIPPGNEKHFQFMLHHIDRALEPITDEEWELLRTEAAKVKNEMIF